VVLTKKRGFWFRFGSRHSTTVWNAQHFNIG